jgi:hypothetical protein
VYFHESFDDKNENSYYQSDAQLMQLETRSKSQISTYNLIYKYLSHIHIHIANLNNIKGAKMLVDKV